MRFEILGYLGALFITVSFIPQVIQSYKTKSVQDVSFGLILTTIIGTIFWWLYGIINKVEPLILSNSILGLVVIYQLYLKLKYKKK